MKIGLLKEIKNSEKRVLLTPQAVSVLVEAGHDVFVESGAGEGSFFFDSDYESIGAEILPISEKIFRNAQLLLKVQPPMPVEYELYKRDHTNISFLFLHGSTDRAQALIKRDSIFFGMESFIDEKGNNPVLIAINEISGNLAIFHAAKLLEKQNDSLGLLLASTTFSEGATLTIIGSGTAARTAAKRSLLMGAKVNLIDAQYDRLQEFKNVSNFRNLNVYEFSRGVLREILLETNVLIGAAFLRAQKPDILVHEEDIDLMKKGSIVIDLTIEHGGCIATARPSSLEEPVYYHNGILHSCITNLSSVVSKTSSQALSQSVLPFVQKVADIGIEDSLLSLQEIKSGLKLYHGKVVNPNLANMLDAQLYVIEELLELNL